MTRYFITGTGTGIGKTFTTCALLHAMPQMRGYKPVISGWDETATTDTAQLIHASSHKQTVEEVSPWRFTAPLSPHRAAALENKEVPFDALVHWSRACPDYALIEGVGGVMVPLDDNYTTLDWMQALGLPVILVTGSYLGAISHTLTAINVLEKTGLIIRALVMNETAGSDVDFMEAQAGLASFITNIPLRIFQPRVSSYHQATEIFSLAQHLKDA